MFLAFRRSIIAIFALATIGSIYYTTQLKFTFSFDQFFPKGDKDYLFFENYKNDFGADDNFMIIAVPNNPSVFDSSFLNKFHQTSIDAANLPYVTQSQSLTQLSFPVKTPFGFFPVPVIHMDDPSRWEEDKEKILNDRRFVYNLIDEKATALCIALRVKDDINISESNILIGAVDSLMAAKKIATYHSLGRANFQKSLVEFQKREIFFAFIASIILVTIIMFLLYRKWIGILIALGSIALGLLLFLGLLGAWGREMNALSALYPVLMLIVGSSDVIHIFSKYTDELKSGKKSTEAMSVTLREIGVATLLTSITTAIGFATLMTSELETIREFGLNAAIGVMIAYVTVLLFTTSLLSFFEIDDIIDTTSSNKKWNGLLSWVTYACFHSGKKIWIIFGGAVLFFAVGITLIKTNYNIVNNLPRGYRVTEDFLYFEKNFGGFRPMEYAITSKSQQLRADDYEIIKEVNKLEEYLHNTGNIKTSVSLAMVYKSFNQMNSGNQNGAYRFPENKETFQEYRRYTEMLSQEQQSVLVSKDGKKTRISARITDLGADSIKDFTRITDQWISNNLDTSLIEVKQTGTGLILDKNSEYVRDNLLQGLGLSIIIISILMCILFRSIKMLLIAMIPNIIPLIMAAGMMGYLNIDMEAGVSIIFTVIFGIAVDDSIHFLTRYKLCRDAGMKNDESIRVTIMESGKAIIITSIVLFFGFMNMIFSVSPPTFNIGILISTTLVGALLCDIFLLPVIIWYAYRD